MLDVTIPMILQMRADLIEAKRRVHYDVAWFASMKEAMINVESIRQRLDIYQTNQLKVEMLEKYLNLLDQEVDNAQTEK